MAEFDELARFSSRALRDMSDDALDEVVRDGLVERELFENSGAMVIGPVPKRMALHTDHAGGLTACL